jgi:ADP-dependent NAD(P)H-hydrate dehydratase / NAD(P)H-hydrate epimerase
VEILTSALEMRELDRQTIEILRVPGRVLMEVAGRAVAESCHRRLRGRGRVAIACGTGNNGGDGFVTARSLMAHGYEVKVFLIGDKARVTGDARAALDPLELSTPSALTVVADAKGLRGFAEYLEGAALAVDALFGTGLNSDVRGLTAEAIDVLNDAPVAVVAVDIPSGVDSDTGRVLGRGVEAVETVTFGFPKRGHYLFPGAALRGELTIADIGIPRSLAEKLPVAGCVLDARDGAALIPRRPGSAHKGNFGHVVIWAGSPATPGAAILAIQGALRVGAGLVSWAADAATIANAPARPAEAMLRARGVSESVDAWVSRMLDGATAIVVGPGLSTTTDRAAELAALFSLCRVPMILDADALNLIAADGALWQAIKAPVVVTPHPKEMARLSGADLDKVQSDRFGAALQLAVARNVVVVLKGAGTVIAAPDGSVAVIGAGNPGMATGGTGDVLAGVIGGLLAQGLDGCQAGRVGALLHAVAGDRAALIHGQAGLRATDIVEAMGGVFAEWQR